MRRKLLFLLILIGVITSCKPKIQEISIIPDVQKNHLQRNRLFGKVQSVSSTLFYARAEDTTLQNRTKLSTTILDYSPDGYLRKISSLNALDDTVSTQIIYYRKDAKEEYWIEKDSTGKIMNRCVYEYDMNGYLAGEKVYHLDEMVYNISYKIDGVGNPIEMIMDYGDYATLSTMQYDKNGLLVRVDEYQPDGKLFKYVTIEHDNYGDEVNRKAYKSANNMIEYTYTQYENDGRQLKVIYEDRIRRYQEIYTYSDHDMFKNWTTDTRIKANKDTYIRNRVINYY